MNNSSLIKTKTMCTCYSKPNLYEVVTLVVTGTILVLIGRGPMVSLHSCWISAMASWTCRSKIILNLCTSGFGLILLLSLKFVFGTWTVRLVGFSRLSLWSLIGPGRPVCWDRIRSRRVWAENNLGRFVCLNCRRFCI